MMMARLGWNLKMMEVEALSSSSPTSAPVATEYYIGFSDDSRARKASSILCFVGYHVGSGGPWFLCHDRQCSCLAYPSLHIRSHWVEQG
jgi:hypothetical protein